MKTRILSSLLIILILLTGVGVYYLKMPTKPFYDANEREFYKEYNFNLVMVGDALIHESIYKDAYEDGNYNFRKMFKSLDNIIPNYDLAFYNQETILGGTEIGLSTYPCFNSPQELGDQMVDLGFNLVSLANNHTLDRGLVGINNSLNYWGNKEVVTAGSYKSFEDRNAFNVYNVNGISYGFLAYTYGTNGIKVPSGKEYVVNIYNENILREDVRQYRDKVDFLIVSMHWGDEYVLNPNNNQKRMAKVLAEENVDLVIGTHSHCVQPIEWIDDTLVIYSLGNLISGQDTILKKIGGIVALDVNKVVNGKEVKVTIDNVRADLLYTKRDKGMKNYEVLTFDMIDDKILQDKEKVYEMYTNVLTSMDNSIQIGLK